MHYILKKKQLEFKSKNQNDTYRKQCWSHIWFQVLVVQ